MKLPIKPLRNIVISLSLVCLFAPSTAWAKCISGNCNDGYGTYVYKSGNKYIGNYRNGLMSGRGAFYWMDGNKYEGQWARDYANGQGTYTYANGDSYVGQWKNDLKSGQGTFYWMDGAKYVG